MYRSFERRIVPYGIAGGVAGPADPFKGVNSELLSKITDPPIE
jgi:hypothetical protein